MSSPSCMVRTQIQLEPEQLERLKRLGRELGVSVAELVRRGVETVLREGEDEARWQRAWRVVGCARSGIGDLAEQHDRDAWDEE